MTLSPYVKPYLPISDQVDLLERRGMILEDREQAERWLRRIGYYRLSGYWYPDRVTIYAPLLGTRRISLFQQGTSFSTVIHRYEFDRKLRLLLLDAIERIEVAMRFQVGHTLGSRGAFAHTNPGHLSDEFSPPSDSNSGTAQWWNSDHAGWLNLREREEKRSKADFVVHFKKNYGTPLPAWVVTEILDFGGLSRLYSGLLQQDRDLIASNLDLRDSSGSGSGGPLSDWMKNLNYIRNACAHHSRVWNATVSIEMRKSSLSAFPETIHAAQQSSRSKIYASLAMISVLTRRINPSDDWYTRLRQLILIELPATGHHPSALGFPDNWQSFDIWLPVKAERRRMSSRKSLPVRSSRLKR